MSDARGQRLFFSSPSSECSNARRRYFFLVERISSSFLFQLSNDIHPPSPRVKFWDKLEDFYFFSRHHKFRRKNQKSFNLLIFNLVCQVLRHLMRGKSGFTRVFWMFFFPYIFNYLSFPFLKPTKHNFVFPRRHLVTLAGCLMGSAKIILSRSWHQ